MPRNDHPYAVILTAMMTLQEENAALKKNASERIQSIAEEVAAQVDDWLNKPYKDKKTTMQDINDFALQITRYVDHRLRE